MNSKVARKVQSLLLLVKCDVIPNKDGEMVPQCSSCENKLCEKDIDLVEDFQISATRELLESSNTRVWRDNDSTKCQMCENQLE